MEKISSTEFVVRDKVQITTMDTNNELFGIRQIRGFQTVSDTLYQQ